MRVSDLIRKDLDEIISEWSRAAQRQVAPAADVPPLVLVDHVPALLGEIAEWLETRSEQPAHSYWDEARKHALDRLRQDFDLAEVIHEYRILRRVILRRIMEPETDLQVDDPVDLARLDEAMDLAIAVAVDRFSTAREQLVFAEGERARLALDAGNLGLWEWFPKTNVLKWDTRTCELLGCRPDEDADYQKFLSAIDPSDRARVDAVVQERLRSPEAGDEYRIEFRAVVAAHDGGRWIETRGRVLARDKEGFAVRFIGTALDVTDRKRSEIELANAAEFRERIIGIVSHDLRTPLSAIHMGSSLLVTSEELPESLARIAGRILANADRMARMIADFLDLTRGRLGGGIPVEPKPANLREIISGVLDNVELAYPNREIVRSVHGDFDGRWDPDRVAQAISNLVRNALEHGASGTPVRVELVDQHDRVEVVVHNDGEPIPPEELTQIFDPFRRATRKGPGLGLGLYITREIARAHGGNVEVASSAGEGTTFRLLLPRLASAV